MKQKHFIADYMTRSPRTISADVPLETAQSVLRENNIRHLPVIKDGKLAGILSDRNVKIALAYPGGERFVVEDAMIPDVFAVLANTDLAMVVEKMAEEKYGSAVILDAEGDVAGIFTMVDACRALSRLLS
ncbi:MAG: CBS domain-containing protein [Deltaproteobacteria bacterium]|nr:CBS domain-containing protein [Deltaproteobacteria bacterium]